MADKETKKFGKKALAVIGAAGLVVGGIAAGLTTGIVVDDSSAVNTLNLQVEDLQTQIDNAALVEPEAVEVDNENLELVLEHIYDNEGDIAYLTEDLDDDEVEEIVDRIVFVNELKSKAVDAVRDNLFDEIDRRWVYDGVELDEDLMERLKIDDRDYEIKVKVSDWEDKEAEVTVTGTFEQEIDGEDVKFKFTAKLDFDNGEFDDFESVKI